MPLAGRDFLHLGCKVWVLSSLCYSFIPFPRHSRSLGQAHANLKTKPITAIDYAYSSPVAFSIIPGQKRYDVACPLSPDYGSWGVFAGAYYEVLLPTIGYYPVPTLLSPTLLFPRKWVQLCLSPWQTIAPHPWLNARVPGGCPT